MLTVSNELKNAFMKAERTIYVRVKIGNRTFYNDNVISVEYDSGSLSGEVFAIGSTYSNSIKITFSDLVEGLKELDEVTYEIGIKLPNGTIEYVPMGVFIINDAIKMDRNNNKTTIECMDKMVMMGGTYVSSLTYPAAIREVALEIANKAGVGVDSTTFARLSADKIAKPEGYTYREAIGLIAQFEAGFATFNRFGKLEIRTLVDPNFAIPPDNYFSKGLVKNEVFFRLGGISCTTDDGDTIIQSGNSAGNQVVLENRVMTKVLLDKIYQKIQTINYYPFSLSWQGNPVIEAGDWVEVEDLQGNKFKTPNLSYSLSFNGGLSAKSSAETVTQSDVTYQYKSPLQQKIEWIHARIDAAGGNVVFVGIDTPTNPKEGDLWFKVIGPDKEILIYRKREDGTLFWDPQISTADINKVAKELESIIKQADLDRAKAEQDINQALTDAKQYTEVKAQEFDNKLLVVNQNVLTATNSANAAVLKADKAIEDVGFLKPDVATAKANAATAIQDATTATQNATTAIQNAQTALNSVATLSQEVDVSITNINGELTRKVSQTTFNTLSGTVGTHTSQISQTQTALLAKAESSLVNTIKGTVDTHTTQIKVVSDGLELKAESSLVNTVKGTVDSHTTQINANSQAITARLTSVQIETLLTGKQYVNQTALNATSNGLTAQITQVSTELNSLEIGGRNYFKNSEKEITGSREFVNSVNWDMAPAIDKYGLVSYTISFDLKTAVAGNINVYAQNGSDTRYNITTHVISATTEYKRYSITFVPTVNNLNVTQALLAFYGQAYGNGRIPSVKNVKMEVGTKATDFTLAPEEMATLEKVSTLELRIDGFQLAINDKVSSAQWTVLSNQVQSKVESATYTSKMTQLDNAINLRVVQGDITAAILADKTIKDTRNDNQIPYWYLENYPRQEVREFKIRTVLGLPGNSTYVQLTTKVPWAGGTSGGVPVQIAESNDGTYQRVSSSSGGSWLAWDKVAESGKLISQINISTEGILLQGKRIQLDGDVTMTTAFVTRLDTLTLSAVYADIPTIRNKVLITDVVTANMIKADTGLFDKVFINDAVVQKLTVKSSFINSVKAIEITADKVTGGTFNAALMNVIGLNANSMTTGTLNGANYSNNLNTGVETFRNPSNGSTLSIQQDKFYFNTSGASHYLIPDNEGLAFVPAAGNTGNNRNAGLRLQSTNFNFVDFGYGSDGGFLHRVGSYPDTMAFINKDGGGFTFSHTGVLDVLNANTRRWDLTIGKYGQFKYGKSAIQLNGYDASTVPKVRIINPATGDLATLDVGYLNVSGNGTGSVELSNIGSSFRIQHATNRNWVFAEGLNGTLTYGVTTLALNGHNNASARLSVFGAGGISYGYMSAANFDVQSERKYKDNIVDFGSALSIISTMKIRQYDKNGISEIGIITDEAPLQLLADNDTKVSLYDYASLAIRGVQELGDLTWHHEVKLSKHELRIKELEEKIKLLESVA